jgi:hypothetical protein
MVSESKKGLIVKSFTRRSFVETAGFGLAALGALSNSAEASAQLVYRKNDWKQAGFNELLQSKAKVKQVYDIRPIGDGKFLNNIKNSLNGLQFGFGVPVEQIKIVSAMHGPSNMLSFDDEVWAKYGLGELTQVTDPLTGAPAVKNIYFPRKPGKGTDPDDPDSTLQDTSIQALQARGVVFLSCHTATEEQVRGFVKKGQMKGAVEEIVHDLQAHALPRVLVVPAMVAAIALLQSEGRFSYITV